MNKIFGWSLMVAVAMLGVSCGNSTSNATGENAATDSALVDPAQTAKASTGKVEFESPVFDFGTVKEGEIVEHIYAFENTGEAPVILSQVSASCGCTTPSYTQTPILPGKKGEIKVSFDSNGQVGKQQKIVTVVSNATNGVTTVQLKGEVLAK
ncbi:DUF1573 domain-containing protein [Sphingobacterium psychroaquaticum]|uniref:DUF1573 domain-containing protein n=1 Tax=Sphingobacterium psychroaquaticum TaxID=561061 RepID=UPI001069D681|nr:DUF1573 domain-containing protein [Sphingobacterium psychroaquaticum]QBQ40677.1 DUF1573 domain-containing protein [Sphingobacterium psychroaquaticum]